MAEKIHEGHRERLRKRFNSEGLSNFEQHEMLEMMLYPVIVQRDTNPIAHELINKFKNLSGVLNAPLEALMNIKGINFLAATYIKFTAALSREYLDDYLNKELLTLSTTEDFAQFLIPKFVGETTERAYLICLDNEFGVLNHMMVGEGSISSSEISASKLLQAALNSQACYAVIAHNHLSGSVNPSLRDHDTTHKVIMLFKSVGLKLIDHIIISKNNYKSMASVMDFSEYYKK